MAPETSGLGVSPGKQGGTAGVIAKLSSLTGEESFLFNAAEADMEPRKQRVQIYPPASEDEISLLTTSASRRAISRRRVAGSWTADATATNRTTACGLRPTSAWCTPF